MVVNGLYSQFRSKNLHTIAMVTARDADGVHRTPDLSLDQASETTAGTDLMYSYESLRVAD